MRQLDRHAIANLLAHGSGRSYAAEVVAAAGFTLEGLGAGAGRLLAKDVGILADQGALAGSALLNTAEAGLARMRDGRAFSTQDRP